MDLQFLEEAKCPITGAIVSGGQPGQHSSHETAHGSRFSNVVQVSNSDLDFLPSL